MMSNYNVSSMSNADVGKAFKAVIRGIGRDDIGEILFNWNESELNLDGDKIIAYPGRDGRYSRGKEGGKVNIGKREFLAWIFSEGPFDEKIYGTDIRSNIEWADLIRRARDAALIEKPASTNISNCVVRHPCAVDGIGLEAFAVRLPDEGPDLKFFIGTPP